MAMYPETTAFYPAVVEAPPAMQRPSGVEDGQGPEERCVAVQVSFQPCRPGPLTPSPL